MSGTKLLLDTNVALYLLRGDRSAADAIHGQKVMIPYFSQVFLAHLARVTCDLHRAR